MTEKAKTSRKGGLLLTVRCDLHSTRCFPHNRPYPHRGTRRFGLRQIHRNRITHVIIIHKCQRKYCSYCCEKKNGTRLSVNERSFPPRSFEKLPSHLQILTGEQLRLVWRIPKR